MDREQYIAAKRQAQEGLFSAAQQHDKAILTLAAGAFALSLTFLKEIAPSPRADTTWLIGTCWVFLVLSICAVLLSFHFSVMAFRRQDDILDKMFANPDNADDSGNCWKRCTIIANIFSLSSFVVGIVLLACFSFQNIKTEDHDMTNEPKKVDVSKGALPGGIPAPQVEQRGAVPANLPTTSGDGGGTGAGAIPINTPVDGPKQPQQPPPKKD